MRNLTILCAILLLIAAINCAAIVIQAGDLGKPLITEQASKFTRIKYTLDVQMLDLEPTGKQQVFIGVTPFSGDVDLYVSGVNEPVFDGGKCVNCIGESTSAHGDFVYLNAKTPGYPVVQEGNNLNILVICNTDTRFQITVWRNYYTEDWVGDIIELEPDKPQVGISLRHGYTYFKFHIGDSFPGKRISLTVTPIFGDPDIYLATERLTKRPNYQYSYWKSLRIGADEVIVNDYDEYFQLNTNYYAAVYGYGQEVWYTVSVTFLDTADEDIHYQQLLDGVPFYINATSGRYRYFNYYSAMTTNMVFTTSPLSATSDPDLYITDVADDIPGPTNAKWRSARSGEDSVVVPAETAKVYRIGVHAYRTRSKFEQYMLTAYSEDLPILLNDGKEQDSFADAQTIRVFKFLHGDRISELTFTATNYNTEDEINMYIADPDSLNAHPDKDKNDYIGTQIGSSSSYHFRRPNTGTYYIGVNCPNPCNFSMIGFSNQSAQVLRDSRTVHHVIVPRHYYRYFDFLLPEDFPSVTASIFPEDGEVDLIASTQLPRPTLDLCHENPDQCWTSQRYKQDAIVIQNDDPKLNGKTHLFIGVRGTGYFNRFSIIAYISNNTQYLSDGLPQSGAATSGHSMFYAFRVPQAGNINVNVHTEQPDEHVTVYVSTSFKHPDPSICQTKCEEANKIGTNYVYDNTHAKAVTYYIGVYVHPNSRSNTVSFSITARQKYHSIRVNAGNQLIESVNEKELTEIKITNVYHFYNYLIVSATLIAGRTELFLSPNRTISTSEYKWHDDKWPGNVIVVKRDSSTQDYFNQREWSIGVYGSEESEFMISVQGISHYSSSHLTFNTPRLGAAPADGEITKFSFIIPYSNYTCRYFRECHPSEDYVINLRVLQGSLDVIVSNEYFPSNTSYLFHDSGPQSRTIRLDKRIVKQGYTFILLKSIGGLAVFELTVSSQSEPLILIHDQPQAAMLNTGYSNFEVITSFKQPSALRVYVEACGLHDAPTSYASDTTKTPNEKDHQFKSSLISDKIAEINIDKPSGIYYIGAQGEHNQLISVFATTQGGSRPTLNSIGYSGREIDDFKFQLSFQKADRPERFPDQPLVYEAWIKEHEPEDENEVNFETVCGIRHYGRRQAEIIPEKSIDNIKLDMPYNPNKIYQVNIIVRSGYSLSAAYTPKWIVHGHLVDERPGSESIPVTVGSILLILVFFFIAQYLIIGAVVNLIRGKRGFDVIPNKDFWFDVPVLVKDGIMFIATCGKRGTSASSQKYEDDIDNEDEPSVTGTGGYGSI